MNANGKLATQKRRDSHDIRIVTVGLYRVKHIFGIYSVYIQHILEPEGNHEENRRKTGGRLVVARLWTKTDKVKKQMTHAGWRVSSVEIMLRRTGLCLHRKEDKPNQREDLRKKCRERYRCQDRQLRDRTRTRKHHKCTLPY